MEILELTWEAWGNNRGVDLVGARQKIQTKPCVWHACRCYFTGPGLCLHSEKHPCSPCISEGNGEPWNNIKMPRLKLAVTKYATWWLGSLQEVTFSLFSVHYCGLGFICETELLTSPGTKDCLLVCPSQRPRTVLADMVGVFLHIHVIVIYKYTILCICQMLFSEQLRAHYPPKCWLRKSSRVDWWLAWKSILCNKPKKDARSLGRRAKAPQRVGHRHSVLLILHDQRWLSICQFLRQLWALQLLVINTMNKTFRFIPQEVKAAKIKKKKSQYSVDLGHQGYKKSLNLRGVDREGQQLLS